VRSIEHCTLIDRESADLMAEREAFAVPTMATMNALAEDGKELGLPPASVDKLKGLRDGAFRSLEILKAAGVKMGLGTDLLGAQHVRQSTEFSLRARVLPAIDVLRSACAVNAELLMQEERLGCVRKGAAADLVVVDGNPLEDIGLLAQGGERLSVIMREGQLHKRVI
jgi:imidazolonepropionase-like amidohydrolase